MCKQITIPDLPYAGVILKQFCIVCLPESTDKYFKMLEWYNVSLSTSIGHKQDI